LNISSEEARVFAENIVDTVREVLIVLDENLRVVSASKSFYKLFQVTRKQTRGQLLFGLGNRLLNIPELRQLLESIIPDRMTIEDHELRYSFENTGEKVMLLNARCVLCEQEKPALIILAIEEVTGSPDIKMAQSALRESESRLRLAQQVAKIGSFEYDIEDKTSKWSPELETLYGLNPGEFGGSYEQWKSLVHPDDLPEVERHLDEAIETGQFETEWRIVRPDSSIRWLAGRGQVFRNEAGKPVRMVGMNLDLTEHKEAEESIRRSESNLSTIMNALPVGVITADERGRLTGMNPATRELWGIPPQTESWEQYGNWIGWWPETGVRIKAEEWALARALRNGEEIRNELVRNEKFGTHEKRYYLANAVPLRNNEGRITGGVVAMLDVTDRFVIEQELRESEARFRTMFESHGAVMLLIEPENGIIVDANAAAETFYGYSRDELQRMGIQQLNQGPPEQVTSEILKAMEKERTIFEFRHRISTGQIRTVEVYSSPIRVADKLLLFSIIQDITDRKQLENQLEDERDFVNAVIQTSGALIIVIDKDGKIDRFNKACEELTGYTADEVRGRTVFDLFILPEEREKVWGVATRLFNGERRVDYENSWITRSGENRYIRWQNSILLDENGVPAFSVATGIDITERNNAEKALRASESRFRGIFDNVAMGIHQVDTNDRFVAVNEYVCQMLGYPAGEFLAMDVHRLTAPEDRVNSDELNRKIRRKELRRVAYEKRYLKADGSRLWVSVTVSSIRDDRDRHIGSVTTVEDISERKKIEEALRESESGLKRAQEIAHLGSWELDVAANRLTWSDEIYRIFGLQPQEFGATYEAFLDHVHPDDRSAVDAAYKGSVREGKDSYEIEHRVIRKDNGEIRFVHEKCQHMRDEHGQIVRSLGMVHDITERKKAENAQHTFANELAAANRDLESFSYSVSHDLRNPLHAIGSFAAFLLEDYTDRLDEEGQDYLRQINAGVKKMQSLIDDLLSLSRIGRYDMKRDTVNISAIVQRYLKELRGMQPERNVEFVIQENVYANADPRLLHLALENLLRNAWKFTTKNELTRIEFGTAAGDGHTVYFIRDNGVGFDQQFSEKIFEPFKRVHAEKEFGGTGVGLSIVQRVIGRHGGKVWAEGEVGKGATFYFTL
jgi:PAS domain S-box-containing protein